jgi:nucleotidyltransferase substrate binding protein (TIGR01987 family)
MTLILTPLINAITRLQEGYEAYQADTRNDLIRDGYIQRFEFTYELSFKLLKRYLTQVSATPDQFDTMSFQDVIRMGSEQSLLLGDWAHWKLYRHVCSKTSHTYDQLVALEVVEHIPAFLQEAQYLCQQIASRQK